MDTDEAYLAATLPGAGPPAPARGRRLAAVLAGFLTWLGVAWVVPLAVPAHFASFDLFWAGDLIVTFGCLGAAALGALLCGWLGQFSWRSDFAVRWSKDSLLEWLGGAGLAMVAVAVLVAAGFAAGWLSFEQFLTPFYYTIANTVLSTVVVWPLLAAGEEFLFRGVLQGALAKLIGGWPALLAQAALFTGVHFIGVSRWHAGGTLGIALFGLLLGLCRRWTGGLALAIGLHGTWNWGLATVCGLPVSGFRWHPNAWRLTSHGPELWLGGWFGPEGGLLAWLLILAMAALLWIAWGWPAGGAGKAH